MDNEDGMENKDGSVSETSSRSLEIRAFFALVDRAHSLQLLNEKNNGSEKPLKNDFNVWQPSFEPEDFNLPSKRSTSTSTGDDHPITMVTASTTGVGEAGREDENRLQRGLKRPRQAFDLAPLFLSEEGWKKGDTGKVFLCDLNKEAESSEDVNGGSG